MVKKSKLSVKEQQHWLIIKGSKNTHFRTRISADYTPKKGLSSLPKFNRDGKYWTPSFKVPFLYEGNGVDYLAEYENKVKGTLEKDEQNIMIPRPRPKAKNYCAVCGEEYQDYLEHVGTTQHTKEIHISSFHFQIVMMCKKWKRVVEQKRQRQIQCLNTKTSISTEGHSQGGSEEQSYSKERRGGVGKAQLKG